MLLPGDEVRDGTDDRQDEDAEPGPQLRRDQGVEALEVARKDIRTTQWCADASAVSGASCEYLKVREQAFLSQHWQSF